MPKKACSLLEKWPQLALFEFAGILTLEEACNSSAAPNSAKRLMKHDLLLCSPLPTCVSDRLCPVRKVFAPLPTPRAPDGP